MTFGFTMDKETYQLIRVYDPTPEVLSTIHSAGIPLDHGFRQADEYIEIIARHDRVESLTNRTVNLEILIENMDTWTSSHNIQDADRDFPLGSLQGNYTYSEAVARMDSLRENFPTIVSEKISIGVSIEGRDIWAFCITDYPDSLEDEPEVLFTGLTHAREPLGMMNLFYYASHLCENYSTDEEATFLVNSREIWFVPIVNPDGYVWNESYYNTHDSPGYHRKNRKDNDCGTGTSRGVDLNRNYGYAWGADDDGSSPNPCSPTYRGTSAFSEPETDALRVFIENHDFENILHYHSWGNVLIHSFGSGDLPPEPDYSTILSTGLWMTEENGYTVGTGTQTIGYGVNGDAVDWTYGWMGLLSYTPEIGSQLDYFWPSENRVLPLCEDQLHQNRIFTLIAGSDPAITTLSPITGIQGPGGFVMTALEIRNRGLQTTDGPVSIRITSLNSSVVPLLSLVEIPELDAQEETLLPLGFIIPFDAHIGEETGVQITVNDSTSYPHSEILLFTVGTEQGVLGDVTMDGTQDIRDVLQLSDVVLDSSEIWEYYQLLSDVNQDGEITSEDINELVNIIMGIE